MPLPPLPEQRRIAAILDQADALRTKRRQAIAQEAMILQSFLRETLAHEQHRTATIGELLQQEFLTVHKDGNHGSLYPRPEDFGQTGVPFLSARAIRENGTVDQTLLDRLSDSKAAELRNGWIRADDVLLAHNASVGKVAVYTGCLGPAIVGTSLTVFRCNLELLHPLYLSATLRSPAFQRQLEKDMSQTTRNQVPITAQRKLYIPLVCAASQRSFAKRTSEARALNTQYIASLSMLDSLFASLQHRAFRGELWRD